MAEASDYSACSKGTTGPKVIENCIADIDEFGKRTSKFVEPINKWYKY